MKKKNFIFTSLFTVCFSFLITLPAQAVGSKVMMLVAGYDSAGEMIVASPAVVAVYEGATYVDASSDLTAANGVSAYELIIGENSYPITFFQEYPDLSIAEFTVSNDGNYLNMPYADESFEGEEANIYYFDENLNELTCPIRITGYEKANGCYFYDYELLGELSDAYFYPMALINSRGHLIGYVSPSREVYTYLLDENSFVFTNETGGNRSSSGRSRSNSDEIEPPTTSVNLIMGVVAAVAGLLIVVLVSKTRKKKNTLTPASDVSPTPIVPSTPVPDAVIPPTGAIEIHPTEPVLKSDALHRVIPLLYAEGGVMDGRRYPVSANAIVIGRDLSCNICYPDKTPGVSRKHCTIFWQDGILMLMDIGSSHGTFLRGRGQIPPNQPVALKSGDVFYLGEKKNGFVLRFE